MGLVAAGLLLIIVNTTTPAEAGAAGMLLVFVLSYVVLTALLSCGIWLVARLVARVYPRRVAKGRSRESIGLRQAYYYATVLALAPVILLSLQSVSGVGMYEIALVTLLVCLGCIYVSRRTA